MLFEGDALEFANSLPAGSMTLIVTSPPYNIGKEYETRVGIGQYLKEQERLIQRLAEVLSSDGSVCWQVGNYVEDGEVFPLDVFYYQIFKDLGLKLRNRIIWHFGHGLHASRRFSGRYETILWFTKGDKYKFNLDHVRIPVKYPGKRHFKGPKRGMPSSNPLGKNPSDMWNFLADEWEGQVWDIPNVKANHPEKTIHPCQFPVELVERCVLALTDENDWVYDPYCGVGSSLIAGLRQNRRVAGADRDGAYIRAAEERIEAHFQGLLKTRGIGTPIHTPTGREKVSQVPEEWKNANTSDE